MKITVNEDSRVLKPGQLVRTKVEIMSDDRVLGMDDDTPVVPKGTVGTVVMKTEYEDLKEHLTDAWVVHFPDYQVNFDCSPDELEIV